MIINRKFLITLAALPLLSSATFAQMTAIEGFNLKDGKPGGLLNGTKFGSSGLLWTAPKGLTFQGAGKSGYLSFDAKGFGVGQVYIPSGTVSISLEAQLSPINISGKNGWLALGFGMAIPPEISWPSLWGKGISVILHGNGQYECVLNMDPQGGYEHLIRVNAGTLEDFSPKASIKVRLEYREGNTLSIWINNQALVDNAKLEKYQFTPEMGSAGFSGYNQAAGERSVESFEMSVK